MDSIEKESEGKIIKERGSKILQFLKNDKFLSAFLIVSLISLFLSIFNFWLWFPLFILSGISALFVYFKRQSFVFVPIILWVAWLAVKIRTLNLPFLKDVTTGGWTLGPDLDPFLFLRWAKYIVAHGSIMAHDVLRYVPLGFSTSEELVLLPKMIAWFHKLALPFGSTSVDQSAVLFPVFMFFLTVIAFFLLIREIFLSSMGNKKASVIAIIASFFLSVIPALIPRTIAGIPEKESAAFLFMFLAFYFFLRFLFL